MKLKDLPGDMNISTVKLQMPLSVFKASDNRGLSSREVYIVSQWFCGIWVKTSLSSTRIYPIQIFPERILDWKVVEDKKSRKGRKK